MTAEVSNGQAGERRGVSRGGALSAERLRWKGSAAARLPLLGLAAAVLQGLLYVAGSTRAGWGPLTAWQILWVSFLGPVGVGLVAGLLGRRERESRGGASWWRQISPRRTHRGAFAVAAGYVLVMHLVVLTVALPYGWLARLGFPGPLARLAELGEVEWLGTLPLLAIAHQVAVRVGLLAAVAIGVAWAVAGTLAAETSSWWWQPWAWSIRSALPLTGTHANGVPSEAGGRLLTGGEWVPLLGCATLALLVAGIGATPWHQTRRWGAAATERGRYRAPKRWLVRLPVAAMAAALRRSGLYPLLLVAAGVFATVSRWWSAEALQQFVTLAAVPVGCTLLAVWAWQGNAASWRSLSTHPLGPGRLILSLYAWLLVLVGAASLIAMVALGADGQPWARAVSVAVSCVVVSALLVVWQLWLAVRFGVALSLAAGAVGTLLALVVGGTGLATSLWLLVPWSWAQSAVGPRAALVLPMALAGAVGLAVATVAAAKRAAGRSFD